MAGLSHRQTEFLNIARAFGRVMGDDLARRFEVSAQTIRKDLNDLCDHRSLTRIHGGAIIASGVENLAYEARRFVAAEEKKAIGIAAAAQIPNGCSLFINIGTTTEEVASALTSHEDLLVITNNLNVAMQLYRHPRIEVIVAGGTVRRADGALIGSTAVSLIGQFKVDYAIIGASAIDEEGALLDFDYRRRGRPLDLRQHVGVEQQIHGVSSCGASCTRSSRSEEHTSELQSHSDLVCRLLLEKK